MTYYYLIKTASHLSLIINNALFVAILIQMSRATIAHANHMKYSFILCARKAAGFNKLINTNKHLRTRNNPDTTLNHPLKVQIQM